MNRDTLLIVDDMEINRAILRALFEQEYNLLEAENGEQAIMLIKQYHDSLAAVLLDLVMPIKSGYQVMAELSQNGLMANIPVVVITSEDSMENEVRAFDLGAADIILKPFEPHVVRRRVQNAVELNRHKMHLEEMVEEQAAKLRESRDVIMDTLSSVIEHRSAETGQHVLRIRMFTKVLLQNVARFCPEYDLDDHAIGVIAEAAALHDIGKISIPDTILNKPGPLSDEEFEIMKSHTIKGCEILSGLDRMSDTEYLRYAYNICRYHHERWDGKGYPEGLKGDNTPICAQAVGIADAYDALTTDRVYKKEIPSEQAITMILNGECGAFSPKLLECLKNVREDFYELSSSYSDGLAPRSAFERLPEHPPIQLGNIKNLPELGQMKYLALLRYLESTVMEVDFDSGVYHLVHQQSEDFLDLRSGNTFAESLHAFAEHAVHPDDRPLVLEILDKYIEDFFSSGLMKRSRKYRIFHHASGEYVWYEGTALRVDLDNPKHHKALIVWKQLDQAESPASSFDGTADIPTTQNLMVGVQQCLNDRWFTMTYVNEGFIVLFGYSKKELEERFHNRYLEMIHPDDRQGVLRQYRDQLSCGSAQELEYRIVSRQGQAVWVLEKYQLLMGSDGREYLNCVLTDITQIKQAQEALRLSMERYQIIQEQTNDIIFEGDLSTWEFSYSANWEAKFGYKPLTHLTRETAQTASHLFPDDVPGFLRLMESIAAGAPYGEAEVRLAKADGKYLWCRIRATTQFGSDKKPVRVVGVILDIDGEKRRFQELTHKAEQDTLTELYTKMAAGEAIKRTLKGRAPEDRFAMLIIDLDNFKLVNDLHGHMFGDAVLAKAASCLKTLFRAADIVARFGGDEFLVFLRYGSDDAWLESMAQRIVEALRDMFQDDMWDCRLTCSVGISRCPQDGADYQSLFQHCDRALYQAKLSGKDRFALYDKRTMSNIFGAGAQQHTSGTRIESDGAADFSVDSIVPQAFKLLYESGDAQTAINAILEMAGCKYNVSRVYIFENSEDGSWCKNTFEWCNEGIRPEIDNLQRVEYHDLGESYQRNFDENGIFYCRDIAKLPREQYTLLESQGIRSLLQCAVRDGGKFVGFVGFDDCKILRMWTQNQIDALTFISELLSTFLLKKRAQDRALATAQNLEMVLDNQNAWLYVIDPDSFALQYINAKTLDAAPGTKPGMRCYEAFFHRGSPCESCPARGIRRLRHQELEIYNPVLHIWSMANACMIRWDGQDACLLACYDIAKYKDADPSRP